DGLAALAMALASALLVVLIVIFGWLVYGRYVLNATPTWVEQSALLIVVWIAFLGAAVGVRRRTHLAVDFVRRALPRRPRAALELFATLAMLAFGAVMAWQGYVMFERTARREIPLLEISEGWRAVPVSLSGAMIVLFCLDDLLRPRRGEAD
ncbi:MAG: TRAP transporter small permease, partial [Pseudomonadota bacterium]